MSTLRQDFAAWFKAEVMTSEAFEGLSAIPYVEADTPKGAMPQFVIDGNLSAPALSKETWTEATVLFLSYWFENDTLTTSDADELGLMMTAHLHQQVTPSGVDIQVQQRQVLRDQTTQASKLRLTLLLQRI